MELVDLLMFSQWGWLGPQSLKSHRACSRKTDWSIHISRNHYNSEKSIIISLTFDDTSDLLYISTFHSFDTCVCWPVESAVTSSQSGSLWASEKQSKAGIKACKTCAQERRENWSYLQNWPMGRKEKVQKLHPYLRSFTACFMTRSSWCLQFSQCDIIMHASYYTCLSCSF